MGLDADRVAPEVLEAIDALNQLEQATLAEHTTTRADLDACWQRILAEVRGKVSQ